VIWYLITKDFKLRAYTNVEYAINIDDRRRTSGATFFLGDCLVSLVGKK